MAEPIPDTYMIDQIICPYCGARNRKDTEWEINFGPGLEGDTELDCSKCDKEFMVSSHVDVSYSTFKAVKR
jgi:DNA-directed RNA polymerase subunit RPC12/RpoP